METDDPSFSPFSKSVSLASSLFFGVTLPFSSRSSGIESLSILTMSSSLEQLSSKAGATYDPPSAGGSFDFFFPNKPIVFRVKAARNNVSQREDGLGCCFRDFVMLASTSCDQ